MNSYKLGFLYKCAEYGVNPNSVIDYVSSRYARDVKVAEAESSNSNLKNYLMSRVTEKRQAVKKASINNITGYLLNRAKANRVSKLGRK